MKLFSIDAEVDGLYGPAFAIAVTIRDDGKEVAKFEGRCPDDVVCDEWVRENVLPAISEMEVTHETTEALEEAFWEFWQANKDGCVVIAHCGSPVESGLFRRCVERDVDRRNITKPFIFYSINPKWYNVKSHDTTSSVHSRGHTQLSTM